MQGPYITELSSQPWDSQFCSLFDEGQTANVYSYLLKHRINFTFSSWYQYSTKLLFAYILRGKKKPQPICKVELGDQKARKLKEETHCCLSPVFFYEALNTMTTCKWILSTIIIELYTGCDEGERELKSNKMDLSLLGLWYQSIICWEI